MKHGKESGLSFAEVFLDGFNISKVLQKVQESFAGVLDDVTNCFDDLILPKVPQKPIDTVPIETEQTPSFSSVNPAVQVEPLVVPIEIAPIEPIVVPIQIAPIEPIVVPIEIAPIEPIVVPIEIAPIEPIAVVVPIKPIVNPMDLQIPTITTSTAKPVQVVVNLPPQEPDSEPSLFNKLSEKTTDNVIDSAIEELTNKFPTIPVNEVLSAGFAMLTVVGDLARAITTYNKKEQRDLYWKAGTKTGLVGVGAGIGAGIGAAFGGAGALPGALLGAGIGGLASLFGGDELGQWLSDSFDGTAQIKSAYENASNAHESYTQFISKYSSINNLINEYKDLNKLIKDGKLDTEQTEAAQTRMKDILSELSGLYPNLITQIDLQNGSLDKAIEKLEKIQKLTDFERETQKINLDAAVEESQQAMPALEKKIFDLRDDKTNLENQLKEIQPMLDKRENMKDILDQRELLFGNINSPTYEQDMEALRVKTRESFPEIDFQLAGMDEFVMLSTIYSFNNDRALSLKKRMQDTQNELVTSVQTYQTYYDVFLDQAKEPLEMPIEDAINNFSKLDDSQKKVLFDTLRNIEAINKKFQDVPGLIKTTYEIDVITKKLLDEQFGSKFDSTLTGNTLTDIGLKTALMFAMPHANGGILTTPHLGLVAEDGPESIIPLSQGKRDRAIYLWEKTGFILGVKPYADGGISINALNANHDEDNGSYNNTETVRSVYEKFTKSSDSNVTIHNINFTVETNGDSAQSVISVIRSNIKGLADEIAGNVAAALDRTNQNLI